MTSSIEIPDHHKGLYRALEIIPGLISWAWLILPIIFSFKYPFLVSIVLLIYTLFWLYRSIRMTIRLITGYLEYRRSIKVDWLKKSKDLSNFKSLRHAIILAACNEEEAIIRSSIEALSLSEYPLKNIFFVLALEERGGEEMMRIGKNLKRVYKDIFGSFIISAHPANLEGEVIGKGANITYAAKKLRQYLDERKIDTSDVVVTTLDADNRVHSKYLANLTYLFLTDPDSIHKSYQPLPMFFNNIWDVPLPIRSISIGSSFWQITESMRPHRLRNFSAHAQSFAALIATNYWSTKTIVEDGHQYWRTYFRFHGNHQVIPIYVPIYQDAVLSPKGYFATFKEQYLQKRRWAWGVSDISYVAINLFKQPSIGIKGWIQWFRLLEGHISWAVTSLTLAFIAWAPLTLSSTFRETVLAVNYPFFYIRLLQTSLAGLIISLTISLLLLPPFPKRRKKFQLSLILEWLTAPILLPITNILFGSLPAIDAQTRLILGKYLEYRVTEKAVNRGEMKELI